MPIFTNTEWSRDHLILPLLLDNRQVDNKKSLPRTNVFAFLKEFIRKNRFLRDHKMLTVSSALIFCHAFPFDCASVKCGHLYFGWSVNLPSLWGDL